MESAWWGLSTQMALPDGLQVWKIKIFNENVVAVEKIVGFQKAKKHILCRIPLHFTLKFRITVHQLFTIFFQLHCRFTFVLENYPEKNNNINVKHIYATVL